MWFLSSSKKTPGCELISSEIDQALYQHKHQKQLPVHGLIIGLEKYRKLKEQAKSRKADFLASYSGMPIIVDSTEQFRISVY